MASTTLNTGSSTSAGLTAEIEVLIRLHKATTDFSYLARAHKSIWQVIYLEFAGPSASIDILFDHPEQMTTDVATNLINSIGPLMPPKDGEKAILGLAKVLSAHKIDVQPRIRACMVSLWCLEWANGSITDDEKAYYIAKKVHKFAKGPNAQGPASMTAATPASTSTNASPPQDLKEITSERELSEDLALMALQLQQKRQLYASELVRDHSANLPGFDMLMGLNTSPGVPLEDIMRRHREVKGLGDMLEVMSMMGKTMLQNHKNYLERTIKGLDGVIKAVNTLHQYVKEVLAAEKAGKEAGN